MSDWEKEFNKKFVFKEDWLVSIYPYAVKQFIFSLLTKERQNMAKALRKEVVAVQRSKMTKENGLVSIYQAIYSYLKKQEGK